MVKKIKREDKLLMLLVVILLTVDQILKVFFLVSGKKFGLEESWNLGIFEHNISDNNIAYILIGVIAIIAILRYINMDNSFLKTNTKIVMSITIAGAASNIIDRLWYKGTINYINIPNFSRINLAYIYFFITWIGMAGILTKYSMDRVLEKKADSKARKFDEEEFKEFLKKKKQEIDNENSKTKSKRNEVE